MLYPGLYEQVINNALNRELAEIPEASRMTRALLQEKAQKTLTARRLPLHKAPCLPVLSMNRRCTRS